MAAFINALSEEGTREEVLKWIHKQRQENGMDGLSDDDFDGWSKSDLIDELYQLWSQRVRS